jgi:hypothetical protein
VPAHRFALDEDVNHRLAGLLRSRGWDIDSAKELGRLGLTDPRTLLQSAEAGQALITHNNHDFRALHEAWVSWRGRWEREAKQLTGRTLTFSGHAGILILPHGAVEDLAEIVEAFDALAETTADRLFRWDSVKGWHEIVF